MATSDIRRRTLNLSEIYPGLMLPVKVIPVSGQRGGHARPRPTRTQA